MFFISIIMSSSLSRVAVADDFAGKLDSMAKDGIDKVDESIRSGVKKLFSPLQKGVEKLAMPYVQKNNAEYFFQLGQAYYNGSVYFNDKYIVKDYGKALEAWKNAAYNGDKLAPYNIGLMYYDGQGASVNKKKPVNGF